MAYTPTNWECGEIVTSERLNKLEEGVADIMSEYVPTEWQCGDIVTAEKLNKLEQAVAEASEGGGGSSDFSTAQVTIINNSGQDFVVACPSLHNDRMYVTVDSANMGADSPLEVVLYKGEGSLDLPHGIVLTMAATGDISISGRIAHITGDGTITIS